MTWRGRRADRRTRRPAAVGRVVKLATGSRRRPEENSVHYHAGHGPASTAGWLLLSCGRDTVARANFRRHQLGGTQVLASTRRTIGSKVDNGSLGYAGSKDTSSYLAQNSTVRS